MSIVYRILLTSLIFGFLSGLIVRRMPGKFDDYPRINTASVVVCMVSGASVLVCLLVLVWGAGV